MPYIAFTANHKTGSSGSLASSGERNERPGNAAANGENSNNIYAGSGSGTGMANQSGSFPSFRKSSVGNVFASLVNSVRQPSSGSGVSNSNTNTASTPPTNGKEKTARRGSHHSSHHTNYFARAGSFSSMQGTTSNGFFSRDHATAVAQEVATPTDEVEANPFHESNSHRSQQRNPYVKNSPPALSTILSNEMTDGEPEPRIQENAFSQNGQHNSYTQFEPADVDVDAGTGAGANRNGSYSNLNGIHEIREINNSISITNTDNSAHNTFNPAAYDFNMANSPTIPNFRVYANEGLLITNSVDNSINNRTRGNTLREGDEPAASVFAPVAMNTENNRTLGNTVDNPITVNDTENFNGADLIIIDSPRASGSADRSNGNAEPFSTEEFARSEEPITAAINRMNDAASPQSGTEQGTNGNNNGDSVTDSAAGNNTWTVLENENENENENATDNTDRVSTVSPASQNNIVNKVPVNQCDDHGYYSIRLTPAIDHSSTHPYMFFGPIMRKLKPGQSLSIGRYTEKNKSAARAAPGSSEGIVFKSKVVSRKHAEFSVDNKGKWFIRDINSSSGTFLNHVRLSAPNEQSPQVTLKDSDILQLGVDYRGGSEEIYRCVKLRVEVNYSWKKKAANFNKEAHKKLKDLINSGSANEMTPCVICLGDIKACQPVFVASCSHSWHYRCIRPLLIKTYPQFLCPNCKAICDLEADFDEEEESC